MANAGKKSFFRAFLDFFILFSGVSTASNLEPAPRAARCVLAACFCFVTGLTAERAAVRPIVACPIAVCPILDRLLKIGRGSNPRPATKDC